MTFEKLNLNDNILKAIDEMGYENATPIQEQAIPIISTGHDLIGCAQTGTGKTAAFAIPIIEQLLKSDNNSKFSKKIKALVITPTRELAIQIGENFDAYAKHTNISQMTIFGGVSQLPQEKKLQQGVDILIATPGRLLDLHNQRLVNLSNIHFLVLDEADQMLDMGFINDIKKIIKLVPQKRQTLLFSATMPKAIRELANDFLNKPKYVSVAPVSSTAETVAQEIYFVEKTNKRKLLSHLIRNENLNNVLVFTRTKHGADNVVKFLKKDGINANAIHGGKSQNARQRVLEEFKSQKITALVATDIAARGIDIDQLPFVINFDLPNIPESYVHRIGRTGRAGNTGLAISFCDVEEEVFWKDILKLTNVDVKTIVDHPFPWSPGAKAQAKAAPVKKNGRTKPANASRKPPIRNKIRQ
ncbi:MAG TPA: DEAD/DEAH box helicase [Edaphocola sp.]|nr:DEAD/DEAH box helicase [Edaphocola sp.]